MFAFRFNPLFPFVLAILAFAAPAAAVPNAAAVIDDGYAGKALQKILDTGKLKFDRKMSLRLSLDEHGHLIECQGLKGADASAACEAAKAASPFGSPPYGVPTYLMLALWSGQPPKAPAKTANAESETSKQAARAAKASPESAYIAKARRELRNSMYIPEQTKPGVYMVTARIKYDPSGKVLDCSILKSSGDKTLDRYCLQGIRRAGKIPPPPTGTPDPLDITFKLIR